MIDTPTLIGRLLVFSGVCGEWRNVRQWQAEDGMRYTVEGQSGSTRLCPLRRDDLHSFWLVEPDSVNESKQEG